MTADLDPRLDPTLPQPPRCDFCGRPLKITLVAPSGASRDGAKIVRAECTACRIAGFGQTVAQACDFRGNCRPR